MSLKASSVTRKYGEQKALDDVSFELKEGEIVALLGPNGAGKSTMMKIITCYLPQSEGDVWVCGHNVTQTSLKVRELVGYLPENNPLYPDMYVREYLGFVAGLHKLGKKTKERIDEMIKQTGLEREQHKKIGVLSKGYKQRVGIAQALIHDPRVLILDEPTTGLDPNQLVDIRQLIRNVGREKTVLLSTHIMQEVEAVCDRVIIINRGKIVADASTKEIQLLNQTSRVISIEIEGKGDFHLLRQIPGIVEIQEAGNGKLKLFTQSEKDLRSEIFHFAVGKKWVLLAMNYEDQSIEQVFRQLTFEV